MSLAKENEKLKEHLEAISAEMVEVRNEILDKNRLLRTLGKKKKIVIILAILRQSV